MIGIFIALGVGILIGQDAKGRGMNAWGWGIGVFLLLIVFLPIYFAVRKPKLGDQALAKKSDESIIDDFEVK